MHILARLGRRGPRVAALVLAAGCGGERPAAPMLRLEATGDTVVARYDEVTGAAWLGGTRWAVLSPLDRAVAVADPARGTLVSLAGARSREIEQPFHLFRAGDSLYVADWLRGRLTAWSLEGRMGGSMPASPSLRGALPRARDETGRWYFEIPPPPGADGSGNLDSTSVVRTDARGAGADTVFRLAPLELAEVMSEGRRRLERRLLSGQDRWGVTADGRVWVARLSPHRVEWRDPAGRRTVGQILPDRVLPVTEPDRELFLRRFEPGLRNTVSAIPFVAIKPPFEHALTAPDGRVWLVKSRAVGDSLRFYQIVDREGRLAAEASHPGLGRIVALGDGTALVAESFGEGVRLLPFRIPAASPDSAR